MTTGKTGKRMVYMLLACGLVVSAAGASIYDNVDYDFGTDSGKVANADAFVGMSNITATFTGDSIIMSKTEAGAASFAFNPSGFSWDANSSTIDMRIRRLGDTNSETFWDVVVNPAWKDEWSTKGMGWYLILVSNGASDPTTMVGDNDSFHTYRWTMTDAYGDNTMYADDNSTAVTVGVRWNQYNCGQINFSLDGRSGLTGVEIDFIGISNTAYAEPPVPEPATMALLAVGGLLALRRRR